MYTFAPEIGCYYRSRLVHYVSLPDDGQFISYFVVETKSGVTQLFYLNVFVMIQVAGYKLPIC